MDESFLGGAEKFSKRVIKKHKIFGEKKHTGPLSLSIPKNKKDRPQNGDSHYQ